MEKIRLGVLFGGKSSEYEVSLSSAYAVLSHVDPEKYEVVRIGITKDGEFFKFDGDPGSIKDGSWCADTEKLDRIAVDPSYGDKRIYAVSPDGVRKEIVLDAVFPVLHGRFGEDGRLQGLLEVMGVPTVGCECTASAVTMDKALTKAVVSLFSDVRQAKAVTAFARDDRDAVIKEAEEKIGYPMFVKPSRSGSSVGCSAVKSREDLPAALGSAFSEDDKILIEERIKGKEIEVAVLEEDGELTVSTPAEIDVGRFLRLRDEIRERRIVVLHPREDTGRERRRSSRRRRADLPDPRLPRSVPRRLLPHERGRTHLQRNKHDARLHADLDVPEADGIRRYPVRRADRPSYQIRNE